MTDAPEALCRQAAAYLQHDKPKRALEAARRAAELNRDDEAPHRLASLALTELGRHPEAVAAAREAVRLAPADWRGQIALAEALGAGGAMLDPQRPEGHQAVAAARRAVQLNPAEPRCFEVLGDIALRAKRWDIADQAYQAALRLDPGNQHAKLNLALVRERAAAPPAPAGGQLPSAEPPSPPATVVAAVLWPTVRTLTLVLSLGSLALIIGGLPEPGRGHVWLGVLLLAATGILAARPWRGLPSSARSKLLRILGTQPRLGLTVFALSLGVLCLVIWTIISLFQPGDLQLPVLTCLSCAVAAVLARLRRGY
ncbi:hypothetical protein [Crossiella sp. CA198]|uniref:hypothetical protein n=1 Tax=Crossiella sp. CA198 TaxID=3455607 RepID=UPI003F8D59FC